MTHVEWPGWSIELSALLNSVHPQLMTMTFPNPRLPLGTVRVCHAFIFIVGESGVEMTPSVTYLVPAKLSSP